MQIFKCRCKYCNQVYSYNTYGNDDNCTMEYCGDCAKVIKSIKVRFIPKWEKVDSPHLEELFQRVEKSELEKKKNEEKKENLLTSILVPQSIEFLSEWDNIVLIRHNGIQYKKYWNDDKPDSAEFYMEVEYDVINEKLTGEPWHHYEDGGYSDFYYKHLPYKPLKGIDLIPVEPLSAPTGQVFWFDWEPNSNILVSDKVDNQPKPNKPELITQTRTILGQYFNDLLKTGHCYYDGRSVIKVKEGLNVDSLLDEVEYEYTFEYYNDDIMNQTIIDIRIK